MHSQPMTCRNYNFNCENDQVPREETSPSSQARCAHEWEDLLFVYYFYLLLFTRCNPTRVHKWNGEMKKRKEQIKIIPSTYDRSHLALCHGEESAVNFSVREGEMKK